MPVDQELLWAARNAFLLILLTLVGISVYQFATLGAITTPVILVWIVGAGGFYGSKWYYGRGAGAEGTATADGETD